VDAIVLLKSDHKTVEKLFKEFEKAERSGGAGSKAKAKAKVALVNEIIQELTTHTFIEETIFYPAAREGAPDTSDHVLESIEEHHVVVWLLSELGGLDPAAESYDAKVRVLMENVRHHVEEEERELFPAIEKALGADDKEQLRRQLERARAAYSGKRRAA